MVVASSNLPGVLNIKSLRPGTLVVDYSFPPVFRVDEAVKRFVTQGDILFTTGGELRLPGVGSRDKHEITGCVLVSLLTGLKEGVSPTVGPLENLDAVAHFEFLEEFGVVPARLQMTGFFLPEEGVSAFRDAQRKPTTTA